MAQPVFVSAVEHSPGADQIDGGVCAGVAGGSFLTRGTNRDLGAIGVQTKILGVRRGARNERAREKRGARTCIKMHDECSVDAAEGYPVRGGSLLVAGQLPGDL